MIVILMIRCEREDTSHHASFHNPLANPEDGPPAGNPDGKYPVPLEAGPEDISNPDQVIGDGTPGSCTCDAFVNAVAKGEESFLTVDPNRLPSLLTNPPRYSMMQIRMW